MAKLVLNGMLMFHPARHESFKMGCAGYVAADKTIAQAGWVKGGTVILTIHSRELRERQAHWIERHMPPEGIDELRRMGLTTHQIQWAAEKRKPIWNVEVRCPVQAYACPMVSSDKGFKSGDTLFSYGNRAIVCDLPDGLETEFRPGAPVLISAPDWGRDALPIEGTVDDIVKGIVSRRRLVVNIPSSMPAFPVSAKLEVWMPIQADADIIASEMPLRLSGPTMVPTAPRDPDWPHLLPRRGLTLPKEELTARNKKQREDELEKTRWTLCEPKVPEGPILPYEPEAKSRFRSLKADIVVKDKKIWERARLRSTTVTEQTLPFQGIGVPSVLPEHVDVYSSHQMHMWDGVFRKDQEQHALRLRISPTAYDALSRREIVVTTVPNLGEPMILQRTPYFPKVDPTERVKRRGDDRMDIFIRLTPDEHRRIAVDRMVITIANPDPAPPKLVISEFAFLHQDGRSRVLVHTAAGKLAWVDVKPIRASYGFLEIEGPLRKGDILILKPYNVEKELYLAEAAIKHQIRADTALKIRARQARMG